MKKILLIVLLLVNTGCVGMMMPMPEGYYVIRKAYQEVHKGKPQKAIKILEDYRNTHPTMPDWVSGGLIEFLSELYEKEGKTDKAINLLEELLKKQPWGEQTCFQMARLYLKEGQELESQALFEKGRKLCLANSELRIGREYEEAKRFDKAIEIYNKTIEAIPYYFEGYICLGNAYRQKGNLNEAITNYEKALELNPADIEACSWLGGLYAISGKKDKAIDSFEQVIRNFPDTETVKMAKGVLYFLNSDSYVGFLQDEQAVKYIKQGDMNTAIDACKEMISKEPQTLKWHFYLAVLYSLKEDNKEAKQSFKKVVSIAPNSKEAKLSRTIMRTLHNF